MGWQKVLPYITFTNIVINDKGFFGSWWHEIFSNYGDNDNCITVCAAQIVYYEQFISKTTFETHIIYLHSYQMLYYKLFHYYTHFYYIPIMFNILTLNNACTRLCTNVCILLFNDVVICCDLFRNIVIMFVVNLLCMFDWWVMWCSKLWISWVKHNHFTASG